MDVSGLPFNQFLGLNSSEGALTLLPDADHLNHVGTVHATVLFAVAEAASGQRLVEGLASESAQPFAVLRNASVKYRRPGQSGRLIQAVANVSEEAFALQMTSLETRGRAMIDVDVRVIQNDEVLLTGTFQWFVSREI